MKKLKTYKVFEANNPADQDYEKEIDKILEKLVEQKIYITMLKDSIYQVADIIENVLPENTEQFMGALKHYEEIIFEKVGMVTNNILDGYPSLKDLAEELENDISDIEDYLDKKKGK